MFTGNAIPKTLTPLAALRCDPARVQAFNRFGDWLQSHGLVEPTS